jgi:predicted SAM-dependent methyltransferase/GT2 family glycosyltransferase
MSVKLYILLPVHNRRAITEKIVDCLVAQSYSNFHLILIDDGSTDGTDEMVKAKIANLTILRGKGDWWWAGSLQQGVDWLKSEGIRSDDIILFLNDDITFPKDFLHKGVNNLSGLNILLLARIYNEKSNIIEESGIEANFRKFTFTNASSQEKINCLSTRGLFLSMSSLLNIGDFYPKILPHYWSDYEFTIRAHKKGFKLITSPYLFIQMDDQATGIHKYDGVSIMDFLMKLFSKKSVLNPIYTSVFIFLACPTTYKPLNITKVWIKTGIKMMLQIKKSISIKFEKYFTLKMVNRFHKNNQSLKVIIGSASTKQKGWVSTNYPLLDLTNKDTFLALFAQDTVSNFLAEHVWEHLTLEDGEKACRNCFDFLRSGGVLRIAVPDGYQVSSDYISQVKPGGSGAGADDHKVLYTHTVLASMLENVGFKIKKLEWFDEFGDFHREDWDPHAGMISRSALNDERNIASPLSYTSLIIDAYKL